MWAQNIQQLQLQAKLKEIKIKIQDICCGKSECQSTLNSDSVFVVMTFTHSLTRVGICYSFNKNVGKSDAVCQGLK